MIRLSDLDRIDERYWHDILQIWIIAMFVRRMVDKKPPTEKLRSRFENAYDHYMEYCPNGHTIFMRVGTRPDENGNIDIEKNGIECMVSFAPVGRGHKFESDDEEDDDDEY